MYAWEYDNKEYVEGAELRRLAKKYGFIYEAKATEEDIKKDDSLKIGDSIDKFTDLLKPKGICENCKYWKILISDMHSGMCERWDDVVIDRKSTRLNSSHIPLSRMPSSA